MQRYSQYAKSIVVEGKPTLSSLPFVDMFYAGREVFHEIMSEEEGRLDIISYKYFRDVHRWEVIAWFNNINDPIGEVTVGKVIRIPIDYLSEQSGIKPFTYRQDT